MEERMSEKTATEPKKYVMLAETGRITLPKKEN